MALVFLAYPVDVGYLVIVILYFHKQHIATSYSPSKNCRATKIGKKSTLRRINRIILAPGIQMCKVSSNSVKNRNRRSDDRQTHTTDASDVIICPMLCYAIAMGQIINTKWLLHMQFMRQN